jgi:hypothetical protein
MILRGNVRLLRGKEGNEKGDRRYTVASVLELSRHRESYGEVDEGGRHSIYHD